jgi:hypothetical protein
VGEIKTMLVVGANLAVTEADSIHVRRALSALDFLVVSDIFLSDIAEMAHVVLPDASFVEKDGTFTNTERRVQRVRKALPPVLVFLGLAVFMTAGGHSPMAMLQDDRPGGADGIPFVPLFTVTTEWQRYTMFSLAHLIEWANEHFLISPFGLVLLLGACARLIIRQTRSRTPGQPDGGVDGGITAFLTIASLAYLVLTFVWNPDYGMRKDWDLFAPSAFVYTLLAATAWVRSRASEAPARRLSLARTGTLVIVASALHTAGWVYYNTLPW